MSDPERQTCPFCAENINSAAKVCARCRQWLTMKSFRHPLVALLSHIVPVTVIWIALAAKMSSTVDRFQNPGPYYSEFPDSLRISESRMNWAQNAGGVQVIFVAGVLTNTSSVTWKEGEFDCRFFNAKSAMIDAATAVAHIAAGPHGESAFRVSIVPTMPTNDYASFKISVANARNSKAIY
jgi:hypothetical protein